VNPRRLLRSRAAVAVVCAGVAVAGGSIAYSAVSASSNTIKGCYSKATGAVRIASRCKKGELPLSWNMQGPKGDKGDPGEKGDKGDKGDTGDTGPAGISGLQRFDYSTKANSESPKSVFAKCKQGKVVGGGAQVFIAGKGNAPVVLKTSEPSKSLNGWAATAEETAETDAKWFITAFALCANVAP